MEIKHGHANFYLGNNQNSHFRTINIEPTPVVNLHK